MKTAHTCPAGGGCSVLCCCSTRVPTLARVCHCGKGRENLITYSRVKCQGLCVYVCLFVSGKQNPHPLCSALLSGATARIFPYRF